MLLLYQSRIASPSNISQNGLHLLDLLVHRHNGLGRSNQLSVSRARTKSTNVSKRATTSSADYLPHESSELLLIACDIPAQFLLHPADRRDWVLKSIVP